MEKLIHITSVGAIEKILVDGIRGVSYWAKEGAVSWYYQALFEDEGIRATAIELPLDVLEQYQLEPDYPGLEEPLTHPLGMREEEVWEAWENTGGTWKDSLDVIQSVRVRLAIPAEVVLEHNPLLAPVRKKKLRV